MCDLFVGDEGIGEMTGAGGTSAALTVLYSFEAASPRLAVSGTGQFALTDAGEIEMTLQLSRHVARSRMRRVVHADAVAVHHRHRQRQRPRRGRASPTPTRCSSTRRSTTCACGCSTTSCATRRRSGWRSTATSSASTSSRLVGDAPQLDVERRRSTCRRRVAAARQRRRQPGMLQGFFPNIRSSGRAEVSAQIGGPTRNADVSGNAPDRPTAGSATSPSRTRSRTSTASSPSMRAAVRLDELSARLGGRPRAVRRPASASRATRSTDST